MIIHHFFGIIFNLLEIFPDLVRAIAFFREKYNFLFKASYNLIGIVVLIYFKMFLLSIIS